MLRQPKRPGVRRHVRRTVAQERAFRVFRLRGLYWMLHALTGPRLEFAKQLVDWELTRLGAEPETERYARRRREWDLEDGASSSSDEQAAPVLGDDEFEEVPF